MSEISKAKQSVINVIDSLENEVKRLTALLEEDIPTPMKANTKNVSSSDFIVWGSGYDSVTLYSTSNWFKMKPYYGDWKELETIESLDTRKQSLLKAVDDYEQALLKRVEEDKAVATHNKVIHDKITQIMTKLGATSYSTYEYPTARSRTKKETRHSAGYLGDLSRCAPLPNAYEYKLQSEPKTLRNKIEEMYKASFYNIQKQVREKEEARKKAEAVHGVALLRAKYTPDDALSDYSDIRNAIMDKCKYLRLAHFLQANRNDWSDGYSYAEVGINGFTVETAEDVEIEAEISELIQSQENGDIDGRCFRDCQYNYSVLFGMVDEALLKDYHKISELLED